MRQHLFRDDLLHFAPLALQRHLVELHAERLQFVDLEDFVVAAGRTVERNRLAQALEALLDLRFSFAEDGEAAAR